MIKKIVICSLAAVILVVGGILLYSALRNPTLNDDTVVATVNGFPITLREYIQSVSTVRGATLRDMIVQGADQADPSFWDTPVNGVTPLEAIKENALNEAVRRKVIQIMALDYGLTDDITYNRFLSDMADAIAEREADLAAGRPVFGSVHERESEHFALAIANLEGDVRIHTAHMVRFTEEALYQAYQETYSLFPVNPGTLHVVRVFAGFQYGSESSQAHARMVIEDIQARAVAGEDLVDIAEDFGWFVEVEDVFIGMRRGMGQERLRVLIQAAYGLEPGSITEVIEDIGGYSVAQAISHEGIRYAPFSEIADIIHSRMAEQYYIEKLARLIAEADVRRTAAFELIGEDEVIYDT